MTEREVVTLKEYVDAKIDAINESTKLATQTLNERLAGMNEFRAALKDKDMMTVTRDELKALMDKVHGDIGMLREWKATLEGKASQQSVNIATILSIAGLLIALVALVWR